jgi:hypothetical protein
VSRLTWLRGTGRLGRLAGTWFAGVCLPLVVVTPAAGVDVETGFQVEVVVTDVPRPVQIAVDNSHHLVILSHGRQGDAAAELYRVNIAALPADASRQPRVVIPFSTGPRKAAFGSLAVDPRSGDLFLGEENGNRIYRLGGQELTLFGIGLNHLLGGSSLTFERSGRLIVIDYTSPEEQLRSEAPPPATFEWLSGDAYHGPVVVRLDPEENVPLPRRLDVVPPLLPKGAARHAKVEPLFRFISVATMASGEIVLLNSVGEVLVLAPDGSLRPLARLPSGHYHRTHMTVGPDGSVFVSSGFQIRQIFRISPAGVVTAIARGLGDPEGIAVDDAGSLYVAENALHRVIRIRPLVTPPRAWPQ